MRGRCKGDITREAGAWLVTRASDGATSREPLLTFDPFGLARGRTHHRRLGPRRYNAWKRERLRFERYQARRVVARPGVATATGAVPR